MMNGGTNIQYNNHSQCIDIMHLTSISKGATISGTDTTVPETGKNATYFEDPSERFKKLAKKTKRGTK